MKNKLLIVMVLLLMFSCAEELIQKPENLIPQDKMVLVLKEMAIINAAKGTNIGKLKDNGIDPTNYVFDKFEIDSAQFVDSDRYYASKPLVYETIYKSVESQLENQRLELEEQKRVEDSLNLLKKQPVNGLKEKQIDSAKVN
ncbi:MAG: DUF4296 domain-containing protein [Maribacter sp.]